MAVFFHRPPGLAGALRQDGIPIVVIYQEKPNVVEVELLAHQLDDLADQFPGVCQRRRHARYFGADLKLVDAAA